MTPSRIVLCADDYGLSPAVSAAIRELLDAGRLSATSCMVVYPDFPEQAALLQPYLDRADIGLHFTLTAERPFAAVFRDAYLNPIAPSAAQRAVDDQVDAFSKAIGRPPDYIDGHQHVHLLPVVREAIAYTAHRIGAYVRLTSEPIDIGMYRRPASFQSACLAMLSRPLGRLVRKVGVTTNKGFRGVRSFRERAPFRQLFRKMISGSRDGWLVMCHAGRVDSVLASRDGITSQREDEFRYMAGPDFLPDLAEAGVTLSTLRQILPTT
jgi:predicted glycoside hydrolase/deacetylase ChbG (UPF0249 family)